MAAYVIVGETHVKTFAPYNVRLSRKYQRFATKIREHAHMDARKDSVDYTAMRALHTHSLQ
jgi:hypothetical protein